MNIYPKDSAGSPTNGHNSLSPSSLLSSSPGYLLTAGAGDCRIYVIDVERAGMLASVATVASGSSCLRLKSSSAATVRALSGHSGTVFALAVWAPGSLFVSASADATARLWDIRAPAPVLIIPSYSGTQGKCCSKALSLICWTEDVSHPLSLNISDGILIYSSSVCSVIKNTTQMADLDQAPLIDRPTSFLLIFRVIKLFQTELHLILHTYFNFLVKRLMPFLYALLL